MPPTLASTVLLTSRIERLAGFYETLLQQSPTWYRDDYAAFEMPGSTLALFTVTGHDEHIRPGAAVAGENRSMKIEFETDDIGATYERLRDNDEPYDWVRSPSAQRFSKDRTCFLGVREASQQQRSKPVA